MTSPELIPSGLYRIIVAEPTAIVSGGGVQEPKCLTDEEGSVTLSPPSAGNARKQIWKIRSGKDGNIIIHRPSELSFPLPYLTYEGTSESPEPGDRIVVRGTDLPPNEWHAEIKSECFYLIGVAGTDLKISMSPPAINPPLLELSRGEPLQFVFDREAEV